MTKVGRLSTPACHVITAVAVAAARLPRVAAHGARRRRHRGAASECIGCGVELTTTTQCIRRVPYVLEEADMMNPYHYILARGMYPWQIRKWKAQFGDRLLVIDSA